MTVKAGQKCTAIRRALVPAAHVPQVLEALRAALARVVVGDPRLENVRMGPLASLAQRREVLAQLQKLRREADVVFGEGATLVPVGADAERGAFVSPTLLYCRDGAAARDVHTVEAFGPVCTLIPYQGAEQAIALARRGGGSLAASVFSADDAHAAQLVLGLAPWHGRIVVVNRHCAKESTGHGSPLPHLVHGGPGRAGGGEVTVEDIERFAALSGDHFYAHMDEAQAARNPLFGGRVAHGYFLVSAAAGLFVDPAYGPVLANYGLDNLRFVKPVKPGTRIKVRLTCKEKSLRVGQDYGEVRWDTLISNEAGETVASYDVLTMVSQKAVPDAA
jgi:oxepin-CoA hydrolase/3-oxo-5,6-dehydrosuberyl-CoA semialdehyde dehydrogenase